MLYNPFENNDIKIPITSLRMESCTDSSLAAEDPYRGYIRCDDAVCRVHTYLTRPISTKHRQGLQRFGSQFANQFWDVSFSDPNDTPSLLDGG